MGLSRYSAWLGIGCGIAGLAISGMARAHEPVGRIKLEASLPNTQAELLQFDRTAFSKLRIRDADKSLKRLLGVSSTSARSLNAWLEDRVQAVVGDSFENEEHMVPLQTGHPFENPGIFPIYEKSPPESGGNGISIPAKMVVIMSNVGEYVYRVGKTHGILYGLEIEGVGTIPMSSPRSGVIQVGPGLFEGDPRTAHSTPAALRRLKTFFHEARHADGNGVSLGFPHAVCPEGHDMHGRRACDRNLNGPYTVGARMLQAMTESCTSCSAAEREALRLQYLDSFDRVLPYSVDGKKPSTEWDPTPEGER